MAGVLFANDLSSSAPQVATRARDLADRYGLPLTVVHVLSKKDLDARREGRPEEGAYLDLIHEQVRGEVRDALSSWWGRPAAEDVEIQVLQGDPDEVIPEFIDRRTYDFVVIGVRNRSRVEKLVFGSAAQSVLLQADCPVLAVPTGDNAR